MNCNKFLAVLFFLAASYQLFCINNKSSNNVNNIKTIIASNKNISSSKKENIGINKITSKKLDNNQIDNNKIYNKHLEKPSIYQLSKQGKNFIKSHELCVLDAYNDPDPQRRSVGWGHQIQPGENLEHITQKKADELFEKDIQWVNAAINRLIANNDKRFIYTQGFIDGLGSLIYNCGETGVTLTEFYSRWKKCRYDKNEPGYINKNDLCYAIAAVKTSRISAPGHIERRYNEHKLMLN